MCDVGAGDAYVARAIAAQLPDEARVVCVDTAYSERQLRETQADRKLTFVRKQPEESFDVVLLLDVLEHVRDDVAFLRDLAARRLRPRGILLVTVPAWPSLYGRHDVALGHFRRYRPDALHRLCREAGLHIEAHGGLFHTLLGVRAGGRLKELVVGVRRQPGDVAFGRVGAGDGIGAWRGGAALTGWLVSILETDSRIGAWLARHGLALPGLSAWTLCRKS